VWSLTSFFSVPKGTPDVRIVYNGTKSGLNDYSWAPWFRLPTVEQHLRVVMPGTYLTDIDVGEQFLNFVIHWSICPYAGVNLTPYFPVLLELQAPGSCSKHTVWVHWTRCGMGFQTLPYNTGLAMLYAEEYIRGDPQDEGRPF
jgi:hypothetical protein